MGSQKKTTPKTYSLRLSNNSLHNIDEITGYIAFVNHQPLNAIKVGDALFRTFDKVVANPYAFKECEELSTKTRMYRQARCLSWSVIYKIKSVEIIVLGIIHQSRRPSKIKILRRVK